MSCENVESVQRVPTLSGSKNISSHERGIGETWDTRDTLVCSKHAMQTPTASWTNQTRNSFEKACTETPSTNPSSNHGDLLKRVD